MYKAKQTGDSSLYKLQGDSLTTCSVLDNPSLTICQTLLFLHSTKKFFPPKKMQLGNPLSASHHGLHTLTTCKISICSIASWECWVGGSSPIFIFWVVNNKMVTCSTQEIPITPGNLSSCAYMYCFSSSTCNKNISNVFYFINCKTKLRNQDLDVTCIPLAWRVPQWSGCFPVIVSSFWFPLLPVQLSSASAHLPVEANPKKSAIILLNYQQLIYQ